MVHNISLVSTLFVQSESRFVAYALLCYEFSFLGYFHYATCQLL